jgi:hypothetical protein
MLQKMLMAVLLVLPVTLRAQVAPSQGVIRGRVIDEGGVPVGGANVHAELHGMPTTKAIRYVETDSLGLFLIDHLDFGAYDLNGGKEDDDYPPTDWALYSDKPTTAVISLEKPTSDVLLKFGPRAAVLIGTVRDAVTGKPLNSGFLIRRSESRWLSSSEASDFRLLIPPDTPVEVEVSAPGYKTWRYADEYGGSSLRLESAAERQLEIDLEPAPDASKKASRFLVPAGYVGWLLLEFNVKNAPVVQEESGVNIFTFPSSGRLRTASSGPVDGGAHGYFYYTGDNSVSAIPMDYRNGKGMVWGRIFGQCERRTMHVWLLRRQP